MGVRTVTGITVVTPVTLAIVSLLSNSATRP